MNTVTSADTTSVHAFKYFVFSEMWTVHVSPILYPATNMHSLCFPYDYYFKYINH